MAVSRRQVLTAAGALAAPLGVAGCGFRPSSSGATSPTGTLTLTTWGTDAELAQFRIVIAAFEKANSGAKVALNAVPYAQMFTDIDAQLQAGKAPDLFRVPYYTFGSYAGRGQLLDLTPHLPTGFSAQFTPAAWAAVQRSGKPFGVPHHTDTSVIYLNTAAMHAAGITSVPKTLESAWTWDEFIGVAQKLRRTQPASRYPFAYNWQGNGVTRWLSWLFEADGRFLSPDLATPEIDSSAGRAAVDFTKSFFPARLVPPNSSIKSTTYAADVWYSQTVAMVFGGAFMIPDAVAGFKPDWTVTYSPRQTRHGGDFGGNALVATAATSKPALAASFLEFVTRESVMRTFCAGASLLPTRRDLVASGITFAQRPELSPVFVAQASTVRAADSSQVASPDMSGIITVLQDQLDSAFVGGQSTAATLSGLSKGIASVIKQ